MLIDLYVMLTATLLGFLSGFIPGIGMLMLLLLSYPFIAEMSILHLIMYYMCASAASQFSGSIVATVLGVPGESSSLPAVREGNPLFHRGKGHFAISGAALGSITGAFIVMLGVILVLPYAVDLIKQYYNNNVQLFILMFSAFSVIFLFGKENILMNIFLFSFGVFLGSIGINTVPRTVLWVDYMPTSIFPQFYQGLPVFPVIIALYVLPILFRSYSDQNQVENQKQIKYVDMAKFSEHIKNYKDSFASVLRGSLVGSFTGLIPHIGLTLSSNLAYIWEKSIGLRKGTYHTKGDMKCLVSAETANNGTAFMQLMPLILIGIPITASEALLLSIIERSSNSFNFSNTIESGLFEVLIFWFILTNILAFLFSWPLIKYVNLLYKIDLKKIFVVTIVLLIFLIYYMGSRTMDEYYYAFVFCALAPIGYMLRGRDTLAVVVGFILQQKIFESSIAFWQIYS